MRKWRAHRGHWSRAGALVWREGRDNRSRMTKSQIKSQLLSNKYHGSYYHTFVEEPVAGAASVYQVQQAWQRHECTVSNSFYVLATSSHWGQKALSCRSFTLFYLKQMQQYGLGWFHFIFFSCIGSFLWGVVVVSSQCELSLKTALYMLKWKWWGKASRQLKNVKAAAGFGLRELVWLSVDAVFTSSVVESETFYGDPPAAFGAWPCAAFTAKQTAPKC